MARTKQTSKRRRMSSGATGSLIITELPAAVLAEAASYLPLATRACLASALTASATKWQASRWRLPPSAASRAIAAEIFAAEGVTGLRDLAIPRAALDDGERGGILACLAPHCSLHFPDLSPAPLPFPTKCLVAVARLLPSTIDRASLAAAVTASATTWERHNWLLPLSAASKAIMGNDGDEYCLDFDDLSESQRAVLTDGELGGVLACIGAHYTNLLPSLELTECVAITGTGLEPLRGSTSLEWIDLSISEVQESRLSASIVLPLLSSIIDAEGSSLTHITLPENWQSDESGILESFSQKHRSVICKRCLDQDKCDLNLAGRGEQPYNKSCPETCSECMAPFCSDCVDSFQWDPDADHPMDYCSGCEKYFCSGCPPEVAACYECEQHYCFNCNFKRGGRNRNDYNDLICDGCVPPDADDYEDMRHENELLRSSLCVARNEIKRLKRLVGEEVEDSDGSDD